MTHDKRASLGSRLGDRKLPAALNPIHVRRAFLDQRPFAVQLGGGDIAVVPVLLH
jgi:hypothetical protein